MIFGGIMNCYSPTTVVLILSMEVQLNLSATKKTIHKRNTRIHRNEGMNEAKPRRVWEVGTWLDIDWVRRWDDEHWTWGWLVRLSSLSLVDATLLTDLRLTQTTQNTQPQNNTEHKRIMLAPSSDAPILRSENTSASSWSFISISSWIWSSSTCTRSCCDFHNSSVLRIVRSVMPATQQQRAG